jgi:hypothetical protein
LIRIQIHITKAGSESCRLFYALRRQFIPAGRIVFSRSDANDMCLEGIDRNLTGTDAEGCGQAWRGFVTGVASSGGKAAGNGFEGRQPLASG